MGRWIPNTLSVSGRFMQMTASFLDMYGQKNASLHFRLPDNYILMKAHAPEDEGLTILLEYDIFNKMAEYANTAGTNIHEYIEEIVRERCYQLDASEGIEIDGEPEPQKSQPSA